MLFRIFGRDFIPRGSLALPDFTGLLRNSTWRTTRAKEVGTGLVPVNSVKARGKCQMLSIIR